MADQGGKHGSGKDAPKHSKHTGGMRHKSDRGGDKSTGNGGTR